MRHQWRCSRSFQEQADGQRRWDQAYLLVVRWANSVPTDGDNSISDVTGAGDPEGTKEVAHARRDLRPGFNPEPGQQSDH
jgi:hypothetical protein